MGGDDGQHRDSEGDVGGRGDGPPFDGAVAGRQGDGHEDRGGHHHPADGRGDRERGTRRIAEISGDEFPFEFEADDKEEDGEQPVGRPGRQTQVEMQPQRVRPHGRLTQRRVGIGPRRVRPHERYHRGHE